MTRLKKRLMLAMMVLGIALLSGCSPSQKSADFQQLRTICELASLKCFYHNIAETEFSGFFIGIGYKKIWIEYSGIVKIGIDASKVSLINPDENGVVQITIPKAEVLGIDFDEESIKEYAESNLPFYGFSTTEKLRAISDAQSDMLQKTSTNNLLLLQGQERAKKVLEQYVKNAGEAIGKSYSVKWIYSD